MSDDVKDSQDPDVQERPDAQSPDSGVEDDSIVGITEPPGTAARLAQIARLKPILVEDTDLAERSREILENEYPEYLLKRMDRPAVEEDYTSPDV